MAVGLILQFLIGALSIHPIQTDRPGIMHNVNVVKHVSILAHGGGARQHVADDVADNTTSQSRGSLETRGNDHAEYEEDEVDTPKYDEHKVSALHEPRHHKSLQTHGSDGFNGNSASDSLVQTEENDDAVADNTTDSSSDTTFKCHSWCVKCNAKKGYAGDKRKRGDMGSKNIFVYRSQGFFGRAMGITVFIFFGLPGALIFSTLNSMIRGCSEVEFRFAGAFKEKVNYPFMLARGNQNEEQIRYATACSKISSPRITFLKKENPLVYECFKHEWLCGKDGALPVEPKWFFAETRCIGWSR